MVERCNSSKANHVVMRYQLSGAYSYEATPDAEIIRSIGQENIGPWLEHVLQTLPPYARLRLVVEVYG